MRENRTKLQMLMLVPLMLLVTGCTSTQASLPPVPAPAIPELPSEARQPPAPQWCSPTCSSGLTKERENWLLRMTEPE
ncbi:hypothetical protein PS417_10230 [Pseudomonas simiae]|uniref:Uncharacterized protein n=1 Tax=Pseudomonas simiae TaxID=321846 RepID=A0A1N7TWI3_9PSED|nr:hypothetical protein PS417_10230 [Pseudomonas simiae]